MRANPNDQLPRTVTSYVPPKSQVTVTIGRNVGSEPMSEHDWRDFQSMITGTIRDLLAPSVSFGPFYGSGEWEGVTEESAVFTFVSHYPASVARVTERLGKVAEMFSQDAVAWSFGLDILAVAP